jgi:hypothetical protein
VADTGVKGGFAMQRHLIMVLERGISEIGPEKVSNHAGMQAILNVFDVDPNMMVPKHTDAFLNAAKNDARVTRIIPPPKDPAFHFEIAQLGDFEVNPLTRVTAWVSDYKFVWFLLGVLSAPAQRPSWIDLPCWQQLDWGYAKSEGRPIDDRPTADRKPKGRQAPKLAGKNEQGPTATLAFLESLAT